jgi:hypothetical protein
MLKFKKCICCKEDKPEFCFSKKTKSKDGLQSYCNFCNRHKYYFLKSKNKQFIIDNLNKPFHKINLLIKELYKII